MMDMATQYARATAKVAPLMNEEFCRPFLERRFSKAVVDALYAEMPRFTRGKNKGKIKGAVHWLKIDEGGWFRGAGEYTYMRPGVVRPGTRFVKVRAGWSVTDVCLLDEDANASDEGRIEWIIRNTRKRS